MPLFDSGRPSEVGRLAPPKSKSTVRVLKPNCARKIDKLELTKDFPTPPLPPPTAILVDPGSLRPRKGEKPGVEKLFITRSNLKLKGLNGLKQPSLQFLFGFRRSEIKWFDRF